MLSSDQVHEVFSFNFGSAVSTQRAFGNLEGLFGILEGTGLQQLNDSLFVACNSRDFSDEGSNEGNSLSEFSLSLGRLDYFFVGSKFGGWVSFIFADGNDSWVLFGHYIYFLL